MAAVAVFYMTTLLLLFGKFYLGAYLSMKTKTKNKKKEENRSYIKDENKNKKQS
jgi:hypothetical protein